MQFGSGGTGTSSHIGCVLLNQTIGVDTTHVPYRGGGPAMARSVRRPRRLSLQHRLDRQPGGRRQSKRRRWPRSPASARRSCPICPPRTNRASPASTPIPGTPCSCPKGTPPALVSELNEALVSRDGNPAFREHLARSASSSWRRSSRTPAYLRPVRQQRDRESGRPDQGERRAEELDFRRRARAGIQRSCRDARAGTRRSPANTGPSFAAHIQRARHV